MTRLLKEGLEGDDVRDWQKFLVTQGYNTGISGFFGAATKTATTDLQRRHALEPDGVVGPATRALRDRLERARRPVLEALVSAGKAVWLTLGGLAVLAFTKKAAAAKPPPSSGGGWSPWDGFNPFSPEPGASQARSMESRWFDYITPAQRDQRFGPLTAVPAPTLSNPEAIRITNNFPARIITARYPELVGVRGASNGTVQIHQAAAESLGEVLADIDRRKLLPLIKSFAGSYVPRFVRGSTTNLSSHAYGTSLDINADENPQGAAPTKSQTELASVFAEHGWFWGDWFQPTRDPMHFEFIGSA